MLFDYSARSIELRSSFICFAGDSLRSLRSLRSSTKRSWTLRGSNKKISIRIYSEKLPEENLYPEKLYQVGSTRSNGRINKINKSEWLLFEPPRMPIRRKYIRFHTTHFPPPISCEKSNFEIEPKKATTKWNFFNKTFLLIMDCANQSSRRGHGACTENRFIAIYWLSCYWLLYTTIVALLNRTFALCAELRFGTGSDQWFVCD